MKTSFNDGFSFLQMEAGTDFDTFMAHADEGVPVCIPHDYVIDDVDKFYADSMGCYLKTFEYRKKNDKARIFLRFDGVYMDTTVYLNGSVAGEWKYGYTGFTLDITDLLIDGSNKLVVMINFRCPNSRWYSGAGIYRNVWLIENEEVYIPYEGVYVHSEPVDAGIYDGNYEMTVEVPLSTSWEGSKTECKIGLMTYLSNGKDVASQDVDIELVCENINDDNDTLVRKYIVKKPEIWSTECPNLYKAVVEIKSETGDLLQREEITVGFRTTEFTTDKGFFLNGKHMKLNGVCEHHDFGALGAAFYPEAWERKLDVLRQMGVNAIRLTHNPSDPQVYEICDRKGFMAISEAFDMWENRKTEFDYARFFPEWHERDVESWVLEARNHPSVIMWSTGNEIYDTHAGERGREVAANLKTLVEKFDHLRNARATLGSNYMPWENTQKVADDFKLIGYNYAENCYDEHHEKHPDWIIYGSETSSIVYSRGVYHFPLEAGILSDDDNQCSSLGNSTTSWGAKSIEKCLSVDKTKEFSLGQFLWTGFDYIGEPTPYKTKNSYFGQVDTAGFPKDPYFIWQAAWTDVQTAPMVHVFPYWSFNDGQRIDVRICTNGAEAELFVNGVSMGRKTPVDTLCNYSVIYEPGYIEAVAYDTDGNIIAKEKRESFGNTDHFGITYSQYGRLKFCEIQAYDSEDHPVENACDHVKVSVKGGKLLGLDNGDSTDNDSYKSDTRYLFRGKLLAIVEGDENAYISVERLDDKIAIRDIKLSVIDEKDDILISAKVLPDNATNSDIDFRLTDKYGNDSKVASLSVEEKEGTTYVRIHPIGDGDYILRATSNDGTDMVKAISSLEFHSEGLGTVFSNPYEFIPGSTYSRSIGELTNGNERGVATARDGETTIIFDNVDFGDVGTELMNIPIFALTSDHYDVEIWKGVPGEEGAVLLNDEGYCIPTIWNTYQDKDFVLSERLKGVQTISVRLWAKVHFKGFSCKEINPLYENMYATDARNVYGDQFEKGETAITRIGNNVTVEFGKYDFGSEISKVVICGHCNNGINTLHVRMANAETEARKAVEFMPSGDEYSEQTFDIEGFIGQGELSLVFLPGCDFDLKWIRFV